MFPAASARGRRIAPAHAGTVDGAGVYTSGSGVTLTAAASSGYVFVNWTENSAVVGTSPAYSLTSDAAHTLVANFLAQAVLSRAASAPDAMTFAWPADATGWVLQESPDLSPGSWVQSARTVEVISAQKRVTVTPPTGRGFFRLQHP